MKILGIDLGNKLDFLKLYQEPEKRAENIEDISDKIKITSEDIIKCSQEILEEIQEHTDNNFCKRLKIKKELLNNTNHLDSLQRHTMDLQLQAKKLKKEVNTVFGKNIKKIIKSSI